MSRKRRKQISDSDPFAEPLDIREVDEALYGAIREADVLHTADLPSAPIVRNDDGTVQIGAFVLSPVGLLIEGEVSQEEWRDFYLAIKRIATSLQWMIGDWIVYGAERKWGETYDDFVELTGLKEKTLRDYAYVARNVQMSIRIDKLSFAHHQLVAGMESDDQAQWLAHAFENRLSVARLRAEIQGGNPPTLSARGGVDVRKIVKDTREIGKILLSGAGGLSQVKRERYLGKIAEVRRVLDAAERMMREEE